MAGVQVGQLFRKRTVRNLDGSIRDMVDEADGGVIIANGRVVNQAKIDELAKIEEDRRTAAQAQTQQAAAPHIAERNAAPSRVEELEKKVEDMGDKLDRILKALDK